MYYKKINWNLKSSNGTSDISCYIYEPLCQIKGIVQISHGMCEYVERYDNFIAYMTERGILVCGNDHLGHGNSIKSKEDLGYFSKHGGWQYLVKDLKQLTDLVKDKYPSLPYFIFGHSMGSFLLRAYISNYGNEITGAIISGTGSKNPLAPFGYRFISIIGKLKGDYYRSKSFNKLFFSGYNKRFLKENSSFSWLTRDKTIKDLYEKDEKCNFIFTANGFKNLIEVQRLVTKNSWFYTVPKNLPLFILSGEEDPVGNYGKGVKDTYSGLLRANVTDITLKLYKDGRHEMINETNYKEVYQDLLDWITKYI